MGEIKIRRLFLPVRFGEPNPVHHLTVDKYYQKSPGAAQDSPRRYVLRVLRPKGVAVIVDLRHDASPGDIEQEIKGMELGRLDEAFTRLTFKQMLLKSAYSIEEMESMISQTPFGKGRIEASGVGFQAWLEK